MHIKISENDERGGVEYPSISGWRQCLCCRLYLKVYGNPIGPYDAWINKGNLVWTIQTRAANAGILPPFAPEKVTVKHNWTHIKSDFYPLGLISTKRIRQWSKPTLDTAG